MEQQRFVRKNMTVIEAQQRQEKKRMRRSLFYFLLFFTVTVVFLVVCFAVFLNIKEFSVEGNSKYSYDEIVSMIPAEVGENIYVFDADETEALIKQKLPYIGTVEISRNLPSTVEINIVEERPVFYLDLAGRTYVLSANLKVLERVDKNAMWTRDLASLEVSNIRKCMVGEMLEFVDARTYDAVTELYKTFESQSMEMYITAVKAKSRFDIYVDYADRFEVYVGDMENIDIKIKFLSAIIDRLGEKSHGTIDVSSANEAAVALS